MMSKESFRKRDAKEARLNGYVFEGDKECFKELEFHIRSEVANQVGPEGLEFLFPEIEWPEAPGSTQAKRIFNVHERFVTIPVPALIDLKTHVQASNAQGMRFEADGITPVMRPITEADKEANRKSVTAIQRHNAKIKSLVTGCQKIVSDSCGYGINQKFNQFAGDPIKCWNYVKEYYGPASMGHADLSGSVMTLINMEMQYNERFLNFMVSFDIVKDLTNSDVSTARALILSDGTTKRNIQVLPDRLMDAVKRCVQDDKSYEECLTYLAHEDALQHQQGMLAPNRKKSARAISAKPTDEVRRSTNAETPSLRECFNCKNVGHGAPDCKLPACGYCEQFGCGHKSDTCPVRLNKKNKR